MGWSFLNFFVALVYAAKSEISVFQQNQRNFEIYLLIQAQRRMPCSFIIFLQVCITNKFAINRNNINLRRANTSNSIAYKYGQSTQHHFATFNLKK